MNKEQNKNLVVKSNHIVEASFKLSLQEQRLILLMVSMIKKNDKDFQVYQIGIDDFNKVVGLKGESGYTEAKEIIRKLRKRELIIKKPESELHINWLSSAEYFNQKGYIDLCFDPKLKPYLLNLQKKFTKYQLRNAIQLKSSYSIRLYELMKQNEFRKEKAYKIDTFRSMLGLKPDEYKLYADLKKRVIISSQKELNKKTDISFEFREKKQGRKVTEIIFKIRANRETEKVGKQKEKKKKVETKELLQPAEGLPSDDPESLFALVPVKVTNPICNLITKHFRDNGSEYVRRNIEYTNQQIRDKRRYRAYLGKSLDNDYASDWLEDMQAAQEEIQREDEKRTEAQRGYQEKREQEKTEGNSRVDQHRRLKKQLKAMPAGQIEELRTCCLENLKPFMRKRLENMPREKLTGHPSFLDYCGIVLSDISEQGA